METLRYLTPEVAFALREQFGTPIYVYSERLLREAAEAALAFPNAYGLTVRYAMKASSNATILRLFDSMGLHFDASSGFEVERAMHAGVAADKLCLSAQELPENFRELIEVGIRFNACSLRQLETFGELFSGGRCGLRFNPGLGSGGTGKTNVGGPHSSFGIWHEWLPEALEIVARRGLTVTRVHTHIGSGSDPAVWSRVSTMSLELVRRIDTVDTLNLGGGYKIGRMSGEVSTDLQEIGGPVKELFERVSEETGRKLHLEVEPGTYLVCNAGSIVSTIHDIVRTGGPEGMVFYKLDSGMTELLRPSLYGAQHPLIIVQQSPNTEEERAMVVGHGCESGDILTCAPGEPETLAPRLLAKAEVGDLCVAEGTGAYCATMSSKHYNSFPEAAEVLLQVDGAPRLIRRRQQLEQITANEILDT